jgi:hypothetical protein
MLHNENLFWIHSEETKRMPLVVIRKHAPDYTKATFSVDILGK